MAGILAAILGLGLAALVLRAFLQAEPASLARLLHLSLPVALGALGAALLLLGRPGLGLALLSGAGAWLLLRRKPARRRAALAHRAVVRTAALEVELDSKARTVDGLVLAGRFEGETLERLDLEQLRLLRRELRSDPESVRLIEAYLDGRFPVWREDA
ncbi:MAG TPA: hypothetical protein VGN97_21185 [Mesorhizobium sp.]|jgi:hypothetical protein|nr:hypothetical protein [Mesorhizobium sp.]